MAGNSHSGRRGKAIERNAIKLERMAVSHAIEIYDSGTPSQKLELTKQIAPKCVQRVTDPSAGSGQKIMIMIMPREELVKDKRFLDAPQQAPQPITVEIIPEVIPDTVQSNPEASQRV